MKTGRNWAARGLPAAFVLSALVAGCGGDPDPAPQAGPPPVTNEVPPVTSEVPPSASLSVAGFIAYLQALVVSAAETLEPVDTSMVTGPRDDTLEPQVVD
jgi:hypothetical protein